MSDASRASGVSGAHSSSSVYDNVGGRHHHGHHRPGSRQHRDGGGRGSEDGATSGAYGSMRDRVRSSQKDISR